MPVSLKSISCSFGVIQVSKGDSVVKKAAYNCREKIHSDKLDETINYTFKQDLLSKNILAPEGAEPWVFNRQEHYNKVEKQDKRINSQLGRTIRIALPHELSLEDNQILLEKYLNTYFVELGMVADYAIHAPEEDGDQRNIHTHVILSMRRLDRDGFAKKKARDWNDIDVETWREAWATEVNLAYEKHGIDTRVTHLSFKRQGSEKLPQRHKGKKSTNLKRYKGIETSRVEYNKLVKEINQLIDDIAALKEAEESDNGGFKPDQFKAAIQRTSIVMEEIERVEEEEFQHWKEIKELEGVEVEIEKSKIAKQYESLQQKAVDLSGRLLEIDRKRQRKPDRGRDSNNPSADQDSDLGQSKRSSTPPTSGSEADAVQNTATLEQSNGTPSQSGVEPNFDGVPENRKPKTGDKNDNPWRSPLSRADRRARLLKKKEYFSDAKTAVEIARQTRDYVKEPDKVRGAVTAYRLKLAELTKDSKVSSVAYQYQKGTNQALECDRLIRDYMRRRGFSKTMIDKAMRRASPAMYRKSTAEAKRYARKFRDYATQQKQKEQQVEREKKRARKRRRGRRI